MKSKIVTCFLLAGMVCVGIYALIRIKGAFTQLQDNVQVLSKNVSDLQRQLNLLSHSLTKELGALSGRVYHLGRRIDVVEVKLAGPKPNPFFGASKRTPRKAAERTLLAGKTPFNTTNPWDSNYAEDLEGNPFEGNGDFVDDALMADYKGDLLTANVKVGDTLREAFTEAEKALGRILTPEEKRELAAHTESLQRHLWEAYRDQAYARGEVMASLVGTEDVEGPSRVSMSQKKMVAGREGYTVDNESAPPGNFTKIVLMSDGAMAISVSPKEFPAFNAVTNDIITAKEALSNGVLSQIR